MPSSLSNTPWLSTYTFDTSEKTISEYPPITHGFRYSLTMDLCGVMAAFFRSIWATAATKMLNSASA
ncbi:hypothetical protein [Fibrobacter sp.]|uniref:hypothetical protein n=1 Tax=Fibrobacter sp. TaxID=35828 RepID=UPI0025C27F73|nr:hypothetical protein [Fibrobacter sp.]